MARHSDANAAAAAAAFSTSAASQVTNVNGTSGGAAAVVTPAMEARFKLEQVTSVLAQLLKNVILTILMTISYLHSLFSCSNCEVSGNSN